MNIIYLGIISENKKKWNGYLKNGKIDTSIKDDRFYVKPYTYEFDLTGSSKALKFQITKP